MILCRVVAAWWVAFVAGGSGGVEDHVELCVSGRSFLPNGCRVRSIRSTGILIRDVMVLCLFSIANNKDQMKESKKERRSQLQW